MPFTIYIFLLDPYLTEWIHTLCLTKGDEDTLTNGKWLSASHISAAQYMLKQRYPRQNGILDTSYLRDRKNWLSVPDEFVQILCVNDVTGLVFRMYFLNKEVLIYTTPCIPS